MGDPVISSGKDRPWPRGSTKRSRRKQKLARKMAVPRSDQELAKLAREAELVAALHEQNGTVPVHSTTLSSPFGATARRIDARGETKETKRPKVRSPRRKGDVKVEPTDSRVRESIPFEMRASILERDKRTCRYCGIRDVGKWHLDHVIPWSKGGETTYENLVTACAGCNLRKGDKTWTPNEIKAGG